MRFPMKLLFMALLPVVGSYAKTPPASVSLTRTTIPAPTASPLPPVSPTVEAFIGELSTAILYASLIGNDNDLAALCPLINPPALSNITGVNGTIVREEVCAAATVVAENAEFGEQLVLLNQRGVSLFATALFAVQVAGNYAGGTDLNTLCSEIEADLISLLFIGYIDNFGKTVKDYVCNAARSTSANHTSTVSSPHPTLNETCKSPTGFGNKVVRVPDALANVHYYVSPQFSTAHSLFLSTDLNIDLPEAVIARYCLDQCIAYRSTGRTCLSVFINQGKPFPLGSMGSDNSPRWYCAGYDAPLSPGVYQEIDAPESYLYGLGINRACNGTYRAY